MAGPMNQDTMRAIPVDPTPEPPIAAAIGRTANIISDLDQMIAILGDKLSPAFTPGSTTKRDMERAPDPSQSDIARFVNDQNARLMELSTVVGDYINRLEI